MRSDRYCDWEGQMKPSQCRSLEGFAGRHPVVTTVLVIVVVLIAIAVSVAVDEAKGRSSRA
jgi:hypothetical protein